MTEELKPCPFCGGEVGLVPAKNMYFTRGINGIKHYYDGWRVFCGECRIMQSWFDMKEEAITAWNRRAERTCHPVDYHIDIDEGCIASTCSECGELLVNFDFEQNPPKPVGYCPNCGAKVVVE